MEIRRAKEIMKNNFIGVEEIGEIGNFLDLNIPKKVPDIDFTEDELVEKCQTHILILCVGEFSDGETVNILNIKKKIEMVECVCFYNQDWYEKENFMKREMKTHWVLIRKNIYDESRGAALATICNNYQLYSAVEIVYSFFVNYFVNNGEILWKNDYIWCSDFDDKGDQIYVGRYVDASGFNKDGFEIHRHLRIKMNYGTI